MQNICKEQAAAQGKVALLLAAAVIALSITSFADSAGTWVKRAGVGTGGTDWTNWNESKNWSGGTAASGSGSTAVATLTAATGQYIDIPSALSIYKIVGPAVADPYPIIRSDNALSIFYQPIRCYLYAPIAWKATTESYGPNGVQICGPISSVGSKMPIWFSDGKVPNKFRFDLYATAAGGSRTETVWPGSALNGWGNTSFHFVAPHGSDSDITGNWSLTEGSPFLARAAGQAEHVLPVGTAVTGNGIPAGTFLKRVFPDGTIELSAAATETIDASELTFVALDSTMSAVINGNVCAGPNGAGGSTITYCTLCVEKYREADDFSVTMDLLRSYNTRWRFKISTSGGLLPGMLSLKGVQSSSAGTLLPVILEDCHLKIAGDSFADANFLVTGAVHTARMTVAEGESHAMGSLESIKGTLVKDGAGKLSASLASTTANAYSGTIAVEAGVFTITNADVFISSVVVKSGATLDVPQGLHIGTLTTEDGAIISGGRVAVDADVAELVAKVTEGKVQLDGAYILDAETSGKQLEISLVNGDCSFVKNGDYWVSTFATNSVVRVEGSGLVDVLVVGGGGGGGTMWGGGGGGGGVIYRQQVFLTNGWYGVTVGLGGVGANAKAEANTSGGDSAFCGLTAFGGGAGGTWYNCNGARYGKGHYGLSGGSGGGGGIVYPANANRSVNGCAGVPGQGCDGGRSFNYTSSFLAGGGGGGAGTAGENAATNSVGNFIGSCGGAGIACAISGVETYYGGGGGGAGNRTAEAGSGAGGVGGGGNGSFGSGRARGGNGTDGFGGGGGGGRAITVDGDPQYSGGGGKGGRGVVILRYARVKTGCIIFIR